MTLTRAAEDVRTERRIYWRCFHCGEAFTKVQRKHALAHFGADCGALPVCQMRIPGEYHLLNLLRTMERELANYRAEDTELWRTISSMDADYRAKIIEAEENGYARGLTDRAAQRDDETEGR